MFGSARNSFRNTPLPGTIDFQSRFSKVDFHESRLDGIKIDRIDEFNFGKMYRAELSGHGLGLGHEILNLKTSIKNGVRQTLVPSVSLKGCTKYSYVRAF